MENIYSKNKIITKSINRFLVIASFLFGLTANAQLFTEWTGSGNWSNNANWNNNYGYGQLEFKGAGDLTPNNDINPTSQWRLFFDGGNSYTLNGGQVDLFDFGGQSSWILCQSTVDQTLNLNVSFSDGGTRPGWITTRGSGNLVFNGNIDVAGNVTELYLANTAANGRIIVNGIISGDEELFIGRNEAFGIEGFTSVEFTGNNIYTADTFIDGGSLRVSGSGTVGTAADIFISASTTLFVDNSITVETVSERGSSNGGIVEISSGNSLTLNGNDKGNVFQNSINGSGNLIIETSGTTVMNLYGVNGLSGTTTIKSGSTLKLLNSMADSDIIIEAGGRLEIEGTAQVTVKSITNNGNIQINGGQSLKVLNDFINNNTTDLSLSAGGDLFVGGNFEQNGTLVNNQRAIFFDGNTNQSISGTALPIAFDYIRVDKSGGILSLTEDIEINQPAGGNGYEQTNGDVTVSAGKSLVVNNTGNFVINSGTFTLESTNLTYSSLIAGNVSGNGTINYDRYVNIAAGQGASTTANDLISPPLSGMTFGELRMANSNILSGTIGGGPTLYLFGPFDNSSVNNYLLYGQADDAVVLDTGVGYRTGSTDGSTYRFTGDVETGSISESITAPTDGSIWNLIGNPYPCYITVSEFLSINNAEFDTSSAGIYGYDGAAADGWTIYNGFTAPGTLIAPGQGFFVASKVGGGTVTFNTNMRSTGSSDDFIPMRSSAVVTNMRLNLSNTSESFNTDIYFSEFSSLGLDPGYDASLFGGSAPSFSIYSHLVEENNGIPFALQALGETDYGNVTVPLGVNANQGEQLIFKLMDNTLPSTVEIYLDDVVENTSTLLNTSDYIITPTTNLSGTGRFYLRFTDSSLSTPESDFDSIDIYANRKDKTITIAGQLLENSTVDIYDMQGRVVKSNIVLSNSTSHRIDVSALQTGIYVVRLSNNTKVKSEKIILN